MILSGLSNVFGTIVLEWDMVEYDFDVDVSELDWRNA